MAEEWGLVIPDYAKKIKKFVLEAVEDGEVIQTKGKFLQFEYKLLLIKHSNPLIQPSFTRSKWNKGEIFSP